MRSGGIGANENNVFHNILSEFYLNGISMNRYQIEWLFSSGKVAVIPVPKPWTL